MVKISPEWVTGPEQDKCSGRIVTFSLWTGMFRDGISSNTLALPVLLYGSEAWTIKARDARRITAAEMKYMRRTAGYTWADYKTNTQITKELKITPILDKLLEYKRNWIQHVNRMPRNRLPRVMKRYFPTGRRNYGRPLTFWSRNFTFKF